MAAPAGSSRLWSVLKRDVIVNVGDVTVVKQVVTTEVPTTVYMPVTVSGEATTIATVSTATREVTTVVTATAIATKVERISVTEGVTVTAVVTTTAFNVQVAPIAIVTGPAVTVFQPSTVIQTIQGVPMTSVVTVMQTKSAEAPPREKGGKGDEESPPPETRSAKQTEAGESKASASGTSPAASPTSGDIFNFNGTTDADTDADADSDANSDANLDSTNTNSNNVTVIAGGSSDASEWFAENKWIWIGVCAILVLVIVGIVAIAVGGKSHSDGGLPAQQSVVLSTPTRSVAAQPVPNSLARPSRTRYARVDAALSSEMSDSSSEEDEKPPVRRSSRSSHRSTVSRAGRRASF
ncbi:hypothetical protein RHOSPDRAFT_32204 [Rhodotorula sp. JG-1b]|nr:hypothetical protein RHOSPDRAFT_32204 [Rhodotorula sp. JG-1b]